MNLYESEFLQASKLCIRRLHFLNYAMKNHIRITNCNTKNQGKFKRKSTSGNFN